MIVQAFPIVWTNRANSDCAAVEHRGIDAIFPRVAHHVAVYHIGD
jgi:hypothetical protein